MAFWLDRFRKEDEEDVWEELKQMLLEQPSDQEIALKNQQEQSKIDAALERMFPDLPKQQSEPYLNYEDLFGGKRHSFDGPTGMAAPVQETPITYRKSLSPNEEIDSKEGWSDELKAQKKAEVARIQKEAAEREWDINVENALEHGKNWTGAALEIGSAAVPGYGGAKLAGTLAKKLAPKLGRKIAKEIAIGTLKGASAGTVEGLGRGLREDENPLKTAAHDTLAGAVLGSAGGAVGGNVEKVVRGSELRKYDNLLKNKTLNKQRKRVFIKKGKKYYGDYEQGVETDVDGLGKIKLASDGLKETITQKPEHIVDVIDLSKNIKKSKVLDVEQPKHSHKYDITKFYHLGGKNVDYQIAENGKADKYFYKITDPYLTGPKPEGKNLLDTHSSTNDIIPSSQNNLNPSQQSIQKPMSQNEWLEELRRRRKRLGWW